MRSILLALVALTAFTVAVAGCTNVTVIMPDKPGTYEVDEDGNVTMKADKPAPAKSSAKPGEQATPMK